MAHFSFPRVQAIPGIDRASLRIDGQERVGYEFGTNLPRPFLYPLRGPSGAELTRMGHPNPVGHEHHKSAWFGHQYVAGLNFWGESAGAGLRIVHERVVAYADGATSGGLAADWTWRQASNVLLKQSVIFWLDHVTDSSYCLDVQSRFESVNDRPVELGKTNFGFFGVRVAKTMSEQLGGGRLTNAEGKTGEKAIFAQKSRWVDYSGPTAPGKVEGIAYLDHPTNPHHPTTWHVRSDGWMVAAFNLNESHGVARDHPLELRYRLFIHDGPANAAANDRAWTEFANEPPVVLRTTKGSIPTLERRA